VGRSRNVFRGKRGAYEDKGVTYLMTSWGAKKTQKVYSRGVNGSGVNETTESRRREWPAGGERGRLEGIITERTGGGKE